MGRPPGAKNKPKNMENNMNEPREFNYEEELESQGMAPAWREVNTAGETITTISPTVSTSYFDEDTIVDTRKDMSTKLYFIEGLVQMRPLQPGRQPVQAEQNRIVYALDIDDAIRKYTQYFSSLNTALEMYVVLRASGSEAIM